MITTGPTSTSRTDGQTTCHGNTTRLQDFEPTLTKKTADGTSCSESSTISFHITIGHTIPREFLHGSDHSDCLQKTNRERRTAANWSAMPCTQKFRRGVPLLKQLLTVFSLRNRCAEWCDHALRTGFTWSVNILWPVASPTKWSAY